MVMIILRGNELQKDYDNLYYNDSYLNFKMSIDIQILFWMLLIYNQYIIICVWNYNLPHYHDYQWKRIKYMEWNI